MPPRRDAFALALGALKLRLRQGVEAPGEALPIQVIAQGLGLSATPVREALSRLAGEHLVDKRGPTYTRPRLDGPVLAGLYNLRRLYLSAALAPEVARRGARRPAAPAPVAFAAALAQGADPAAVIEMLFLDRVRAADDPVLIQAYQQVAERLAPFQALERQAIDGVGDEALALAAAFEAGDAGALRSGVRRHHRRRMAQAHVLVRLADGEKYRTDMI